MANELYFLQSRVEGFRGDQGTGAPVYTTVTADSAEDYALPYTSIASTTQNTTWGYGCLWAPYVDASGNAVKLNTFWAGAEMVLACSSTYTETDLAQYAPWVIRSSDAGAFLFFRAVIGSKNIFRLILGTDLTDTTKWVDTGIRYTATGTARNRYAIRVYAAGTNAATIILFVDGVRQGTWTGDMTLYKDFDSMSFHQTTPADTLKLYYATATNFSIRRSYAKTRVATGVGSLKGWTGDTTPFATYPTNYNTSGGLYATTVGEQVTVTLPADAADKSGYTVAAVSLTAALITDDDSTVASAAAIIKDTSTSTVTPLNALPINSDGQGYTWNIPVNPEDSKAWTSASLANMEFGLERTV